MAQMGLAERLFGVFHIGVYIGVVLLEIFNSPLY